MLLIFVASTQMVQAHPATRHAPDKANQVGGVVQATSTPTPVDLPTVSVPQAPVAIPTVVIPAPTPTATPKPKVKHRPKKVKVKKAVPDQEWIWAFLTSYCPGSAGWISSSGLPVHYGMLANDFYPFGTRVFLPVLGITGVVQDRIGSFLSWNHFDVWSPVCYGTPTGWFKVAVQNG